MNIEKYIKLNGPTSSTKVLVLTKHSSYYYKYCNRGYNIKVISNVNYARGIPFYKYDLIFYDKNNIELYDYLKAILSPYKTLTDCITKLIGI